MNSLSWMIYLADVAGSLNALLWVVGVVSLIVVSLRVPVAWMLVEDDEIPGLWATTKTVALKVTLPCLALAAIVPSAGTIYAIAASEMGEKALDTETGGKAVKALNAWLDRQITEGE